MATSAIEPETKSIQKQADHKTLNIIHFSDVHDIDNAPRFLSALNAFRENELAPLVFFSGNFISQSNISCVTRGHHMMDIMNNLGITCGTFGSHDFDFGEKNAYKIMKDLTFPIIHTNLLFSALIGKHLVIQMNYKENKVKIIQDPDISSIYMATKKEEKQSDCLTIGVIAVCENWLHLVRNSLDDKEGLQYMDMIEITQKYIDKLREEYNVDMMIALTHSKLLNDRVLADKITGIDLILSGRDHIHACSMTNHTRTLIVKSGANFNQFSWIRFMVKEQQKTVEIVDDEHAQTVARTLKAYLSAEDGIFKARKYWYKVRYYELNDSMSDDEGMKKIVEDIHSDYNHHKLDCTLAEIACNLDCTQFSLLNGECNSANFVSDIMRVSCGSDCVILSATTFLGISSSQTDEKAADADAKTEDDDDDDDNNAFALNDASISAFNVDGSINRGGVTYRDILEKVLSDNDTIILLKLTGSQIRSAIEHGLSKTEDLTSNELINGVTKWPHVSGLRFVYDPMEENGAKIKTIWIQKDGYKYAELVDDNIYSVATSAALAKGADGYEIFEDPVSIERDVLESVNGQMMLIEFLRKINYINKLKLLTASSSTMSMLTKRANKKEIEAKIAALGLRTKALSACVDTKWVSSFLVIHNEENTKEDLHADDNETQVLQKKKKKGGMTPIDDDNVELVFKEKKDARQETNVNENEANDKLETEENSTSIELGGDVMNKAEEEEDNSNNNDGLERKDEDEENKNEKTEKKKKEDDDNDKSEENITAEAVRQNDDLLTRRKSLNLVIKEKIANIDKEDLKQKFANMKVTSKIKLNLMGKKLKKMAIESQNQMGKLSEKATQLMNKDREIKYDANGNILDVQIFVIKPSIDYRVMTVDDEKRWLKLRGESGEEVCSDVVIDNHSMNQQQNLKRKKLSEELEAEEAAAREKNNENTKQRRASLAKLLFVTKSKSISSEILKKIDFKKKKTPSNDEKNENENEANEKNDDENENDATKKKTILESIKGFNK